MYKPIEKRVTEIVRNSLNLNSLERADITFLIECYKGADKQAQDYGLRNKKVLDYIKTIERRGTADIKDIWWIKHLLLKEKI